MNCLSVFYHFVGLVLNKGLRDVLFLNLLIIQWLVLVLLLHGLFALTIVNDHLDGYQGMLLC